MIIIYEIWLQNTIDTVFWSMPSKCNITTTGIDKSNNWNELGKQKLMYWWCIQIMLERDTVRVRGFNVTFNNISGILVKETRVPRENHRSATSRWHTISHKQNTNVFQFLVLKKRYLKISSTTEWTREPHIQWDFHLCKLKSTYYSWWFKPFTLVFPYQAMIVW